MVHDRSHRVLLIQGLRIRLRGSALLLGDTHLAEAHSPSSFATLLSGAGLTEADLGAEFLALPRLIDHLVELVNLLKSEAFGLVNHEPDESKSDGAKRPPDEKHFGLQVGVFLVHEIRCRISYRKVEQPIRSCGA